MPAAPPRSCTTPGCRTPAPQGGRCGTCAARRAASAAKARPSPAARGYGPRWRPRRRDFLRRHPLCVLCGQLATVADHHPLSRRQLVAMGVPDPDADQHLRPLCAHHHATETAKHQPGGWHRWNTTT